MYLWNTKALAKELKEGTLSESEKFKYYIIGVILYEIFISFGGDSEFSLPELLFLTISGLLITFFGTYLCYKINNLGDGVNFIERFICISVPLVIKITVWSSLPILILAAISGLYNVNSDELSSLDSFWGLLIITIAIFLTLIFYWRVYIHMKWISHDNDDMINS